MLTLIFSICFQSIGRSGIQAAMHFIWFQHVASALRKFGGSMQAYNLRWKIEHKLSFCPKQGNKLSRGFDTAATSLRTANDSNGG